MIDKAAIKKFTDSLQRELDANPVTIPVEMHGSGSSSLGSTTNNYHGNVVTVTGDNAQVAWDNGRVKQTMDAHSFTTTGFDEIVAIMRSLIETVDQLGLSDSDAEEIKAAANDVLVESTNEKPNTRRVRISSVLVKGILAPIASGIVAGVSSEASDLARTFIHQITAAPVS